MFSGHTCTASTRRAAIGAPPVSRLDAWRGSLSAGIKFPAGERRFLARSSRVGFSSGPCPATAGGWIASDDRQPAKAQGHTSSPRHAPLARTARRPALPVIVLHKPFSSDSPHTSLQEESMIFKLLLRSATCEPNWILKENTRSFDSIRGLSKELHELINEEARILIQAVSGLLMPTTATQAVQADQVSRGSNSILRTETLKEEGPQGSVLLKRSKKMKIAGVFCQKRNFQTPFLF
ncbi:hypothetical protein U9M48_015770 [Paspalum notatum var. saurae]|uniref:Uncharacterized protein n=1 Tax=Paspalum notatum var. saurae TaxID=547442 RepID=A0AAQ3WM55_PASNO